MPVARGIDRHAGGPRGVDPAVQHRNDFVSAFDGQRTAWAEVVLYVDDEEGIAGLQHFGGMSHAASPLPHDACGAWPPRFTATGRNEDRAAQTPQGRKFLETRC